MRAALQCVVRSNSSGSRAAAPALQLSNRPCGVHFITRALAMSAAVETVADAPDSAKPAKLGGWDFYHQVLKSPKFIVAPMVDHSELAWRMLSRAHKADLCYTPMLHSAVFCRDPRYRASQFQTCPEDRPLITQFCANDPETLLEAARYVEDHCDAVDINLGCPQGIAKKGRYGAFLMEDWTLIESMVSLLHKELKIPVTCKVRVYDSVEKTIQYAQMLERAGAQVLTVHGRTRDMKGQNTGLADWEIVKIVREAVNIPVVANGNVLYLEDVHACLDYTGTAGVMTAEANLYNPALFSGEYLPMWDVANQYLDICRKYATNAGTIRAHLFKIYHHALPLHIDLRAKLASCVLLPDYEAWMEEMNNRLKAAAKEHEAQGTVPPPPEHKAIDTGKALVSAVREYPYWICHAYTRPIDHIPATKRKACELGQDEERVQTDREELLRLRMERKLRRKKKQVDDGYVAKMCTKCVMNNPAADCLHRMCKRCCVVHSTTGEERPPEMCATHRYRIEKVLAAQRGGQGDAATTANGADAAEEKVVSDDHAALPVEPQIVH